MKKSTVIVFAILVTAGLTLSACGGVSAPSSVAAKGPKVLADQVVFTGSVDSIFGDQWVIDGQTISVDDKTALENDIAIGDTVKVEAMVGGDGSVIASSIEHASPDNLAVSPDPSETPDATEVYDLSGAPKDVSTEAPVSSGKQESPETSGFQESQELMGVVDSIGADTWVINGQTYSVTNFSEIKGDVAIGDTVKVEFAANSDGSLTITEVQPQESVGSSDGKSQSDGSQIESQQKQKSESQSESSLGNGSSQGDSPSGSNSESQGSSNPQDSLNDGSNDD